MSDELLSETWVEKRERWRGVRFLHASQAEAIANLFPGLVQWTVEVDTTVRDGIKLTIILREMNFEDFSVKHREIVINRGDLVREDDDPRGWESGKRIVVPSGELYKTMELETKK